MLNMRPDLVAVGSTFTTLASPVGELLLTSDGAALTGLYPASHRSLPDTSGLTRDDALFAGIRDQLNAYFRGKLSEFKVPLKPAGTEFQQLVWKELGRIPCAATRTYAEVGARVGKASASRAVGAAVAKNPILIIIPCHRVMGTSGAPIGYSGGLKVKQWLFEHEAAMLPVRMPQAERAASGSSP
jgi:methylated-DNA-[protein]-cysteine S-methyltransferase